MHDLVHDAVERSLPLAEATNVTLSAALAPSASRPGAASGRLRCDPAAIGRALANLLDNAVGAAPGGSVEIAVDVAQRDLIVVDVVNRGAVPHEARKHLFERTRSRAWAGARDSAWRWRAPHRGPRRRSRAVAHVCKA